MLRGAQQKERLFMRQHQTYSRPLHQNSVWCGGRGVSIIELLVVIMIIGVAVAVLLSFGTFSVRTASLLKQTTQASFLVQESVEALKNYRDNTGWTDDDASNKYDGLGVIATGVALHLELSGDTPERWQLLLGKETQGIFTRDVRIDPVERDGLDNIVESGGTLDSETKKATVTVSWEERGGTRQLETITYLTNWR